VTRRFVVILSAVCVFTAFGIARRLWDCQTAGFLAAALVAFLPPLISATNGREYTHAAIAALVGSLHAMLLLQALASRSRAGLMAGAAAAAAAAWALLAVWEGAWVVLVLWMAGVMAWRPLAMRSRVLVLGTHAAAGIVALLTLPHLTSGESFPVLAYVATRARFLVERPLSAATLSDHMRHVWSLDHAPLTPQSSIQFFLPMLLLAAALAINAECRARGRAFVAACAVAIAGAVVALVDRSMFPLAAMAVIPVVAGGARSMGRDWRVRAPLLVLGFYCVFAGVAFREKGPDAAFQVARTLHVAHRDPDSFLWVSLENTDRELVRFVSTRTSVQESILAPNDLSALLLTFTGRRSVLLPDGNGAAAAEKHILLTRAFYASEEAFHALCKDMGIDYVVYSIDVLLDSGRYSPRYLAALESINPDAVAFQMHFAPESLRHFTLQYENDHYRFFKVTDGPETIFLTDHPPVYQPSLLRASGGGLETFRRNIEMLIYNYVAGVTARSRGDLEGAMKRLRSCVNTAPHFTRARLALADVYMDLERFEDARRVIMEVVAYAPDNSQGMYYAAYISARLGQYEKARAFLTILLSHERDPDMLEKARLLEAYMDQGLPLDPSAPTRQ
jgi:tetratricopeptide (TPR) repeat protein